MTVKIPNVEKFLFFLKLETFGLILGWIGLISATISLAASTFVFGLVTTNYSVFLNATTSAGDQENQVLQNLQYRKIFLRRQKVFLKIH